jgi:hypothetical protein
MLTEFNGAVTLERLQIHLEIAARLRVHHLRHGAGMAGVIVSQAWTARDVRRIIRAHPTPDEALEAALTAPARKSGKFFSGGFIVRQGDNSSLLYFGVS